MDTVLKADIFFVVTTIAVVIGTTAFVIAAYFVAKAAQVVREEVERAAETLERVERSVTYPLRFTTRFASNLFSSLLEDKY